MDDHYALNSSVRCSCGFNALGVDSFVAHVVSSVIEQVTIPVHAGPDFNDGVAFLFDSITDHFTGRTMR